MLLRILKARSAEERGISSVIINEETSKDEETWKKARLRKTRLIFVSPEMATGPSFRKLWTDDGFRKRLALVFVDEAHCIKEWGGDFRPAYELLGVLRSLVGYGVPFAACSATIDDETFDHIWSVLRYGELPFYGVDVGSSRPELTFLVRTLENTDAPEIDFLRLFPADLDDQSAPETIPKTLVFRHSHSDCARTKDAIRGYLPKHLRHRVQTFTSEVSEDGKMLSWSAFHSGEIRVIIATAAASMGCNVPDVELVIDDGSKVEGMHDVIQKIGRAARQRGAMGRGLFLAPKSLVENPSPVFGGKDVRNRQRGSLVNRASRRKKEEEEEETRNKRVKERMSKSDKLRDSPLVDFINIPSRSPGGGLHSTGRHMN